MYCTPCARFMKSITPNTSVRPAATRNKRTPSCSPLRIWTARSVVDMGDPRRGRSLGARPSPLLGRGLGRGGFGAYGKTITPHPTPLPAEVGFIRLRPFQMPNSGKPEFRWEREQIERAGWTLPRSRRTSLHRTILGVRIGVVLEHLLDDLRLELAVGALGDLDQIEVLDRVMVGVELEAPAQ